MIEQEIIDAEADVERTGRDMLEAQDKLFGLLSSSPTADEAKLIKAEAAEAQRCFIEALKKLHAAVYSTAAEH
jgi:hypothetical protein